MARLARKLKNKLGILPDVPTFSKGKVISEEQKATVKSFYESDEISRMCPGQKDCLSIRDAEGQKVKKQKRLVLGNLKELFHQFKSEHNTIKIGFSTFASLRPPYCVLAGSGGTHSVCVCTYHQNPKLQLSALGEKDITYKNLLECSVCDIESEECMLGKCKECPKEDGVKCFLESLDIVQSSEEIRYKQWVTVDRCTIMEKVESVDNYVTSLSQQITKLARHHFVAKKQAQYFKELKENLSDESEAIIVGDFSENYSFIVQDAAQGFHWENSQCTVHPFVLYYKSGTNLSHSSFCFLSAQQQHNTTLVYTFLSKLLSYIKLLHPHLKKIHYFSDGCAGQYKNRFNFINLCHHKEDFGLSCEWNFFATSHGKNACDGIGGTVKRSTARASLQRPFAEQILTPEDMFTLCEEKLSDTIKYFFITAQEVEEAEQLLNARFAESKVIPGTQKLHRVVPLNKEELLVYQISSGRDWETKKIVKVRADLETQEDIYVKTGKAKIGDYVGCIYDRNLYYGLVEGYSDKFDDYYINFLVPFGKYSYVFPEIKDSCAVPGHHIVGIMSIPILRGGTRIQYVFKAEEVSACVHNLDVFHKVDK